MAILKDTVQNGNNIGKLPEKKKKRKKKGFGKGQDIKESPVAKKEEENVRPPPNFIPFYEERKRPIVYYKPYMSEDKVNQGLESGELVKGTIRISQRNSQEAYVDNTATDGFSDYLILGVRDRNRALNGDVVIVKPRNRDSWVLRTSLFRNWKEQNNIGNEFELSLNNEIYDAESVGSTSGMENDNENKKFMDNTENVDEDETFVTADEEDTSSVDDDFCDLSFDNFDEEDSKKEPIFRLAFQKLNQLRLSQNYTKRNDESGKLPKRVYKYDRKQMLRYRKRVPNNFMPNISSEVKCLIMKPDVVQKSRKSLPFQFVGNFNKNNDIPNFLLIRTCEVVYISEKKFYGSGLFNEGASTGARVRASGHLTQLCDDMLLLYQEHFERKDRKKEKEHFLPAIFVPTDSRLPKMMVPHDQLPKDFVKRPQDFLNVIFVVEMLDEWSAETSLAKAKLINRIGEFGDLKAETQSLLLTNNIDTRPFSKEVLSELKEFFPKKGKNSCTQKKSVNNDDEADFLDYFNLGQFKINQKILNMRRDFRRDTVFTIDPISARDLDDALHIKASKTADGADCWEVGVHIADVSYFVQPGGKVDAWARRRGTSVYLVDEVIPMLPRILCEELCSLNPGVDRLTFSVVWKMDEYGNILEEWFGRSVIRSCAKLAYEHAQEFIDNPTKEISLDEMPENIYYSHSTKLTKKDGALALGRLVEIRNCVLALNSVARQIRGRRFENGALRLDAPKLKIKFSDSGHKYPCGVCLDERSDANFLVEEFMLLANMAVAKRISKQFPDVALLRRHPPPKTSAFDEAVSKCERLGFPLGKHLSCMEISSALRNYESQRELKRTVLPILFQYLLRSMQLALYFCTGVAKSEEEFKHFALSVDRYTHFTSPIRRYPDLMVHRLLSACLGYRKKPKYTPEQVEVLAKHCNTTKLAAKVVSEGSAEIFLNFFIKEVNSFETYGIVTYVSETYFEVILLEFGLTERISLNKMDNIKNSTFQKSQQPGKSNCGRLFITFKCSAKCDEKSDSMVEDAELEVTAALLSIVNAVVTSEEDLKARKDTDKKNEESNTVVSELNKEAKTKEKESKRKRTNKKAEKVDRQATKEVGGNKKQKCEEETADEEIVNMDIRMLSIVKVALLPEKRPGKHYATLVVNADTARLTFADICGSQQKVGI